MVSAREGGRGAGWQRRRTLAAGLGRWFGLRLKKTSAVSRCRSGRLPLCLLVCLTPGYLGIIGSRAGGERIPRAG